MPYMHEIARKRQKAKFEAKGASKMHEALTDLENLSRFELLESLNKTKFQVEGNPMDLTKTKP